jgi:hypothetical protein
MEVPADVVTLDGDHFDVIEGNVDHTARAVEQWIDRRLRPETLEAGRQPHHAP